MPTHTTGTPTARAPLTAPERAAVLAALAGPAGAQERGGLRPAGPVLLEQIEANRGCPLSTTTVGLAVTRAGPGQAVRQGQSLAASPGCRPLVSTQLAAGVNLALGRNSQASQSLAVQAPPGVLATTRLSRGANLALGPGAAATQRILNLTTP